MKLLDDMTVSHPIKKSPPCNRQVRYQQGSSVLIFNLTTEITEEPFFFLNMW